MEEEKKIGNVGGKNKEDDRIDKKKKIGFMEMVLGMLMEIIEIKIV